MSRVKNWMKKAKKPPERTIRRLEDNEHFHYDGVEISQFGINFDKKSFDVSTNTCKFSVTTNSSCWLLTKHLTDLYALDKAFHICLTGRFVSGLEDLSTMPVINPRLFMAYLKRFVQCYNTLATPSKGCSTVLNWFEMNNVGSRAIIGDRCSMLNLPALGAAHVVKKYDAKDSDELSVSVDEILSILQWPDEENAWCVGKKGTEFGFLPKECVSRVEKGSCATPKATAGKMPPFNSQNTDVQVMRSGVGRSNSRILQHQNQKFVVKLLNTITMRTSKIVTKNSLKEAGLLRAELFGGFLAEAVETAADGTLYPPEIVTICTKIVEKHGLIRFVYRQSGASTVINKLHAVFQQGEVPAALVQLAADDSDNAALRKRVLLECILLNDIFTQSDGTVAGTQPSIHAIASLLKMYFRNLPEPLFTCTLYEDFLAAIDTAPHKLTTDGNGSEPVSSRLLAVKAVIARLPPPHLVVMRHLFHHLAVVATAEAETMLCPRGLATVWAPSLIWAPTTSAVGGASAGARDPIICVTKQVGLVEFCIRNATFLFTNEDAIDGNVGVRQRSSSLTRSTSTSPERFGPKSMAPTSVVATSVMSSRPMSMITTTPASRPHGALSAVLPRHERRVIDLHDARRLMLRASSQAVPLSSLDESAVSTSVYGGQPSCFPLFGGGDGQQNRRSKSEPDMIDPSPRVKKSAGAEARKVVGAPTGSVGRKKKIDITQIGGPVAGTFAHVEGHSENILTKDIVPADVTCVADPNDKPVALTPNSKLSYLAQLRNAEDKEHRASTAKLLPSTRERTPKSGTPIVYRDSQAPLASLDDSTLTNASSNKSPPEGKEKLTKQRSADSNRRSRQPPPFVPPPLPAHCQSRDDLITANNGTIAASDVASPWKTLPKNGQTQPEAKARAPIEPPIRLFDPVTAENRFTNSFVLEGNTDNARHRFTDPFISSESEEDPVRTPVRDDPQTIMLVNERYYSGLSQVSEARHSAPDIGSPTFEHGASFAKSASNDAMVEPGVEEDEDGELLVIRALPVNTRRSPTPVKPARGGVGVPPVAHRKPTSFAPEGRYKTTKDVVLSERKGVQELRSLYQSSKDMQLRRPFDNQYDDVQNHGHYSLSSDSELPGTTL